MKNTLSILSLTLLATSASYAQTTIIGGATRDGNFESGTFATFWSDEGTGTDVATNDVDLSNGGTYAVGLGKNNGSTIDKVAFTDTGYSIGAGDSLFTLNFDYGGAFRWDTSDQVTYDLFYTDDNLSTGTATSLLSGFVDGVSDPASPFTYSNSGDLNTSDDLSTIVGKNVFLRFSTVSSANEFSRLDNVSLTVTTAAIPEPSTYALVAGSLALGIIAIRRRRSA